MLDFNPSQDEIVSLGVTLLILVVIFAGWLMKKVAGAFFWIIAALCLGDILYTLVTGETLSLK